MLTKEEARQVILAAKQSKGLTYSDLGEATGCDKVFIAAAIEGQASVTSDVASKLTEALSLDDSVATALESFPMKGCLEDAVPVDPLIYRFHEITHVYGTAMKAVIHEMFGDGIMSAIDFEIDIKRLEDPKGDRVVVTYNGKFLPYRKW
ncbi:MAG: cyanase [Myxococcota bacterium]